MNERFDSDLQRRLSDSEFAEEFGAELAKSEVAVALTRARLACNVTQVDLANRLGTNQSYIAKLERGDANPTIGMIGKVLAFMGLRLKVHTERILYDTAPRVITSGEGLNDLWNAIIWPSEVTVTATTKTETREESIAVGG
ncbi:MAG: helix-turn-helix transcriptional regulator [Dehalococcoidia bacterium]